VFTKSDLKPRPAVPFGVLHERDTSEGKKFLYPLKGNPAREAFRLYNEQKYFNATLGIFDFEADERVYQAFYLGDEATVKKELRLCRNRGGNEPVNFIHHDEVWSIKQARKNEKLWERRQKLIRLRQKQSSFFTVTEGTMLHAAMIYEQARRDHYGEAGAPLPDGESFKVIPAKRKPSKKHRKGT
jgi:hypothetical protein